MVVLHTVKPPSAWQFSSSALSDPQLSLGQPPNRSFEMHEADGATTDSAASAEAAESDEPRFEFANCELAPDPPHLMAHSRLVTPYSLIREMVPLMTVPASVSMKLTLLPSGFTTKL